MKTLRAMTMGVLPAVTSGTSWAQNGTMMNGGYWGGGWMGGYGGTWMPLLMIVLVVAVIALIVWIMRGGK